MKMDGMMVGTYGHEAKEATAQLRKYVEKVHRGLIKASGYGDDNDVEAEDWKHCDYIQDTNKEFDMRRLDKQIKSYLLRNAAQTRQHLNIRDNTLVKRENEEEEDDRKGQVPSEVRLWSGDHSERRRISNQESRKRRGRTHTNGYSTRRSSKWNNENTWQQQRSGI